MSFAESCSQDVGDWIEERADFDALTRLGGEIATEADEAAGCD